jgi:hypothetical protein
MNGCLRTYAPMLQKTVIFVLNVIGKKLFVMVITRREHSAFSAEFAEKSGHPNSKNKEKEKE